jgi:GntR family transcriptional regulator
MPADLRLRVDPDDPLPVYEQLRTQLETLIVSRRVVGGQQLPTIRQLAGDLGIAKATVSRVYEALEREGLIETRGRNGTVVADAVPKIAKAERTGRLQEAADRFALEVARLGGTPAEAESALARAMARLRLS